MVFVNRIAINLILRLFLSLLLVFGIHRIFTFTYLAIALEDTWQRKSQSFFIGFLSDIWIAGLGTVAIFMIVLVQDKLTKRSNEQKREKYIEQVSIILFLAITLMVALHQPYVEFFGVQLIPFHLTYIFDVEFISANHKSAFNFRCWITFFAGALSYFGLKRYLKSSSKASFKNVALFLVLFIVAITISHVINIKYKIQMFIPSNLQLNLFEKFYENLLIPSRVNKLTRNELEILKNSFLKESERIGDIDIDVIKENNTSKELEFMILNQDEKSYFKNQSAKDGIVLEIRNQFDKRIENHQRPMIIIVLVEALRLIDMGIGDQTKKPSITPMLDDLAKKSIFFKNAYSTGIVTRGGQEAVFCGYPGSQNTSVMRPRNDVKITCIPDLLNQKKNEKGRFGETFWLHGGEGKFDSQEQFWKKHHVNYVFSKKDFPKDLPSTGWGIGDKSFVEYGFNKLFDIRKDSKADFLLGIMLTVSNHIPWDLPTDVLLDELPVNEKTVDHPSHLTLSYSDNAIGQLVNLLKSRGFWTDAILILTGDHGTLLPTYNEENKNNPIDKQAHVPIIIAGGIIDHVLKEKKMSEKRLRDEFVSHVDIEVFVREILRLKNNQSFGTPLFNEVREAPVMVDLGDVVYFPKEQKKFEIRNVIKESDENASKSDQFLVSYYRAFLTIINNWSLR